MANNKTNARTAWTIAAVVAAMIGLSYAAVPLYAAFCKATGYGGVLRTADTESATLGQRIINVHFDTNVSGDLPWSFEPEVDSINVRTGQTATVFFKVKNLSNQQTAAVASYNVSEQVSPWFYKISCFCTSEQHLGPGESADLPVVFYLDPALEKDEAMKGVETVTLSYTFYSSKQDPQPVADAAKNKPKL
ncbi:cytochrome c oxidase assembly protein [Methylovirgula sp. 4M-Z18]|uniref:cytochrome c oxidase assembly protein n=1 Tax=Methylovirgula sp. 4M-Z18 TaxID=2293567 RepID=UPI0013145D8E|nr:cytochrome c oxidase assembly protein [Methylovirgula sp. 4M-Z18]